MLKKNLTLNYLLLSIILALSFDVSADKNLPIPRFASIKSKEVNARTGPSNRYPIEWVFVKKGEPVEIFAEFEQWRRIRDKFGEGGWVHSSMLSGKRFVVIKGDEPQLLYKKSSINSEVIARIAPEVRCELYKCLDKLCNIRCQSSKGQDLKKQDFKGWILKNMLWGVYPDEKW